MRKGSQHWCHVQSQRTVGVEIPVPVQLVIQIEDQAAERGITKTELLELALGEAVARWNLKINRRDRIATEQALRAARDGEPIGPLLDRFRTQMEASRGSEHKDSSQGLTASAGSAMNRNMSTTSERSLRERREALGLSREKLARLADISTSAVAQFEEGRRPASSKALPLLEAALRQQERIAA